eukprot:COSAG04_NODE_28514_length_275_cov_0.590909_1_plen_62_part_10
MIRARDEIKEKRRGISAAKSVLSMTTGSREHGPTLTCAQQPVARDPRQRRHLSTRRAIFHDQ